MFNFLKSKEQPAASVAVAKTPSTAASRYVTKIFILEDNELYATLLQHSLDEEDKYDVSVFATAAEMFNHIHENPDIVTIDYNLPDRDGLDVLREVKNYNRDIQAVI